MLRPTAACADGRGLRGQRLRRIAGIGWRRWTMEVRANRTTTDSQRDGDRAQACRSTHDHLLRVPRNIACTCCRTTDCADRMRASPIVSQWRTRLVPHPQKILACPMIVIACSSTCSWSGGRSMRRPMMAQQGLHTLRTMSSCRTPHSVPPPSVRKISADFRDWKRCHRGSTRSQYRACRTAGRRVADARVDRLPAQPVCAPRSARHRPASPG